MTLSLAGQTSIVATSTIVDQTATRLTASFNFNHQTDGNYTVTITNPDGTTYTVDTPLELEPVSAPTLWAEIIGPSDLRANYPHLTRSSLAIAATLMPLMLIYY